MHFNKSKTFRIPNSTWRDYIYQKSLKLKPNNWYTYLQRKINFTYFPINNFEKELRSIFYEELRRF